MWWCEGIFWSGNLVGVCLWFVKFLMLGLYFWDSGALNGSDRHLRTMPYLCGRCLVVGTVHPSLYLLESEPIWFKCKEVFERVRSGALSGNQCNSHFFAESIWVFFQRRLILGIEVN